jgi:adenosylcobinamide-GDP ribazoletransferase
MRPRWRHFIAALRCENRGSGRGAATADGLAPREAARLLPLAGIAAGLVGAGVYWVAAQWWPTSIAVVLSMLATTLLTANLRERPDTASAGPQAGGTRVGAPYWVFALLVKYNALMALSAASLPFPLPAYLALGLIMVAGHAASHALMVSVAASNTATPLGVTATDLSLALIVGFAPAALLGIPGLIGLAGAIAVRLGLGVYVFPKFALGLPAQLGVTQQVTETCFYLGALATWKYI